MCRKIVPFFGSNVAMTGHISIQCANLRRPTNALVWHHRHTVDGKKSSNT